MSWKEAAAGVWLGTRAVPHNPLPQAQDHLPAAYAVKRGLLSESEVEELQEWVRAGRGQRMPGGATRSREGISHRPQRTPSSLFPLCAPK